jgi:threonine dehydrogenase-like Zn-dependent dehydrogenase
MQAAVTRSGQLVVDKLDDPVPGPGQVLVRTAACGICGSDLHALAHFDEFTALNIRVGGPGLDRERDVVFGHEFCAEVVDFGPNTERKLRPGTLVCSIPMVFDASGPQPVGYSHSFPGGFGELMVLQEMLLLPVPGDLTPEHAALTEPLAVGEHAVAMARIEPGDVCLVIGCGPVGLAVIAALKGRGHGPVIAVDFSAARRRQAEDLGADDVVDPATASPYQRWADFGVPASLTERGAAELLGGSIRDAVIFEAVGAPGVLQSIIDGAPPKARIVVVGVCMKPDQIDPFVAVCKELEVRFSMAYSPAEYAATLERLANGSLDPRQLITGTVGLDGVADAFVALREPDAHVKVIVEPGRAV